MLHESLLSRATVFRSKGFMFIFLKIIISCCFFLSQKTQTPPDQSVDDNQISDDHLKDAEAMMHVDI